MSKSLNFITNKNIEPRAAVKINTPLFTESQLVELEQMQRGWLGVDLLNMVQVGYMLMERDTGAKIHTFAAMTPVDMSKIILNPLITILFIADTGMMAPICVRILGCTPMET